MSSPSVYMLMAGTDQVVRDFGQELAIELRAAGISVTKGYEKEALAALADAQRWDALLVVDGPFTSFTFGATIDQLKGVASRVVRANARKVSQEEFGAERDRILHELALPRLDHPNGHIFLSYAHEDASFVDDLRTWLVEHGYAVWEYRTSPQEFQTPYREKLAARIAEALVTVCVVSPSWTASEISMDEYRISQECQVPVLLLRIGDPGACDLITGFTYIDFADRQHGLNAFWSELIRIREQVAL